MRGNYVVFGGYFVFIGDDIEWRFAVFGGFWHKFGTFISGTIDYMSWVEKVEIWGISVRFWVFMGNIGCGRGWKGVEGSGRPGVVDRLGRL